MSETVLGALLSAAALLLLAGYHGWLIMRLRRAPLTTTLGLSNEIRRSWVQVVMAERRDILAVQTLRNWTMAATFLASTAMLLTLGLLSVAATGDRFTSLGGLLTVNAGAAPAPAVGHLLGLAALFTLAFLSFTLAIRQYNHIGFLINVPPEHDNRVTPESVGRALNRGAAYYTLGMRAYYLAIPLAFWLFGPLWLLGATLVLLAVLVPLDRTGTG
jgi:uncharacterized membrane protein